MLVPVLGALALTAGCATGPAAPAAPPGTDALAPGQATASKDSVSFAEATLLADPRAYDGPSTAVLATPGLHPVTDRPSAQLPVTVTDAQGTQVTVTDTSRILALDLYGTNARIVAELGLLDSLVGRDTSTTFAEAADLPNVTPSGHDLSAEAILALDPSVIVADTTLGPWDVILQMREAGIPVVITPSTRSLESAGEDIRLVAEALGVPEAGEALAERTEADVAATSEQVRAATASHDPLRMAFLYVRGGSGIYYLFGGEVGTGSLIEALGGEDIATEIGWRGMKPLTDEGLIAMQPEVLLVMSKGLASAGGVDGLLAAVPAIAETPAGQHRRIVDMDDSTMLAFGPTSADVLDALAVAIYAPGAAPAGHGTA